MIPEAKYGQADHGDRNQVAPQHGGDVRRAHPSHPTLAILSFRPIRSRWPSYGGLHGLRRSNASAARHPGRKTMGVMKTLRKRWAITLVLFVLTIVATGGAYAALPSTYQAKANVILLPSATLAKTAGGNPYLAFDSTLNEAADVIRYEVT